MAVLFERVEGRDTVSFILSKCLVRVAVADGYFKHKQVKTTERLNDYLVKKWVLLGKM